VAAGSGVADESDVFSFAAHTGCEFVHQVGTVGKVVESFDVDVGVDLIAGLVCDDFDAGFARLLEDLFECGGRVGNDVIAFGFSAMSLRMISACFCGSASGAPVMVALTPV